jgi:tRNA wybutosine-synthesizing protein 1
MLPPYIKSLLVKQRYHLIGEREHAAVKKCHWLHKALVEGSFCYKSWYGIQSHRCIQFTPMLFCSNACLHCWRLERGDVEGWGEPAVEDFDSPEALLQGAVREQLRIVSGYKSNPKVDRRRLEEARHPRHFAISLAGEPTLYPMIGDLVALLKSKGFTTFLVTNGLYPKVLASLSYEPSQLYVSVNAPSEEIYRKVCRPALSDAWGRLMETLDLLKSFKCPTALRLTLIKGVNDVEPEGYAKLIERAAPLYVEVKAYMYLGFSRRRLKLEAMPRHSEVVDFAKLLERLTSYTFLADSLHSRVALLSRVGWPLKVSP